MIRDTLPLCLSGMLAGKRHAALDDVIVLFIRPVIYLSLLIYRRHIVEVRPFGGMIQLAQGELAIY